MAKRGIPRLGICTECGKRIYTHKAHAKKAARVFHPGEHLAVYRCGEWWHYGHLPKPVREGKTTRSEHYGT
jgi:hypothetical protein